MGSRFCPVPSSHPSMGLSQDSDRNNVSQDQRRPPSKAPASGLLPGRAQEHTQQPVAHSESHLPAQSVSGNQMEPPRFCRATHTSQSCGQILIWSRGVKRITLLP